MRRLTSHGLRHTAATHMVANADDVGELRAAAEVLGHSPDLLLRIYAHTLPESLRVLTDAEVPSSLAELAPPSRPARARSPAGRVGAGDPHDLGDTEHTHDGDHRAVVRRDEHDRPDVSDTRSAHGPLPSGRRRRASGPEFNL